jgi:hypothetical protein
LAMRSAFLYSSYCTRMAYDSASPSSEALGSDDSEDNSTARLKAFGGIAVGFVAGGASALFHAPLRSASGGARSLKPMVGRGPRDQSSGQKPRARLPEALACRAALRFKRARRRDVGRGWIAAFTTELRPEPIFRGGSG